MVKFKLDSLSKEERKKALKLGVKYVRFKGAHGLKYWVPLHYRKIR